ncbi:FAD/NAD(P)-binding domain-containing protein [Lophium mytilinum]|uniref:FAD/NAD(P)-binding domain-containing protein n=1 Tax=Lophium mytilinum TaxID=390894 RepID=A0A6A6QDT9_9PEZI|nr:FAD/NAD(P)-binding domain-containing protein [Lophium mytilinum]
MPKRVNPTEIAVIGSGAAGLAAATYLLAEGMKVTMYERNSLPGGIWTSRHPDSIYESAIYDNLSANVPRQLIEFSHWPWPPSEPAFPTSDRLSKYMMDYFLVLQARFSDTFETRFNATVTYVCRTGNVGRKWSVKYDDGTSPQMTADTDKFHGIVVATGAFDEKHEPNIPGLANFKARHPQVVSHSKDFKNPLEFRNKHVLIVGNAASGFDISRQILPLAKSVSVSTRTSRVDLFDSNITRRPEILQFKGGKKRAIYFHGNSIERDIDRVIFCTGFKYTLPFLYSRSRYKMDGQWHTQDSRMYEDGFSIPGLYKHLFHRYQGPKPRFKAQSAVIARVFAGRLKLPPNQDMERWENHMREDWECRVTRRLVSPETFHALPDPHDKEYILELQNLAKTATGADLLPPPTWTDSMQYARENRMRLRREHEMSMGGFQKLEECEEATMELGQ